MRPRCRIHLIGKVLFQFLRSTTTLYAGHPASPLWIRDYNEDQELHLPNVNKPPRLTCRRTRSSITSYRRERVTFYFMQNFIFLYTRDLKISWSLASWHLPYIHIYSFIFIDIAVYLHIRERYM